MSTKLVNGIEVPLSAEDIAERAADAAAYTAQAATSAAQVTRAATRAAMRAQWDGLPAWIRGPYRPLFSAANELLDEGDDEAAGEMVAAAEPNETILADATVYEALGGKTKTEFFWQIRAVFAAAIGALGS